MNKILIDYKGEEIKSGMIVKRENLTTGEITYFLYEESINDKSILYKYNTKGSIDRKNILSNIYFDNGIDLFNTKTRRWIIMGPKEIVYKGIFQ